MADVGKERIAKLLDELEQCETRKESLLAQESDLSKQAHKLRQCREENQTTRIAIIKELRQAMPSGVLT